MSNILDRRSYVPALDGIRAVGIVFVLAYHYILVAGGDWTTLGFSWIGIQMFFVLSGFLITRILLATKNEPFTSYAGQFYWRRVLRIFPVYFGFLAAAAVCYALTQSPYDLPGRAPYLLTFTQNFTVFSSKLALISRWFSPFWSLAVEEQFYLVWPLIVFMLDLRKLRILLVAVVLLGPVFRYWFANQLIVWGYPPEIVGQLSYVFTLSQVDALACGAAIAVFNLPARIAHPRRWMWSAVAVLLTVGAVNWLTLRAEGMAISVTSLGLLVGLTEHLQHTWSYTLVNLTFMFTILHLLSPRYRGLFAHPVLASIGKVTYGMYVMHMVVLIAMWQVNVRYIHSFIGSFVLAFAVTWMLAWVSYNLYERRFLALKDLWKPRSAVKVVKPAEMPVTAFNPE